MGKTRSRSAIDPVVWPSFPDDISLLGRLSNVLFNFNLLWENEMHYHHISPDVWGYLGGIPNLEFFWKEVAGKRRLIGNPNKPMRVLHRLFGKSIMDGVMSTGDAGYGVRKMPSATGCVQHFNPMLNARKHAKGKFFCITDLKNAYPSVDLARLALIITFLARFEKYRDDISLKFFSEDVRADAIKNDPLYEEMLTFLSLNFAGLYGRGLAVGGPLSPYLMNLYCEVYLDTMLRRWCEKRTITYTRYVDDLVFSCEKSITPAQRKEIRRFVNSAGFEVNHRKSKVLALNRGTVFVTKVGLEQQPKQSVARIVFPQKKRRRLHGIIKSYLAEQMDWPEKVSGLIAEFLYYFKTVQTKTATDLKTFALCKAFEAEWAKYRKGPVVRRRK